MAVKRVGLIAVLSSFFLALLGIPNSLPVTNAAWNNDEEVYVAELLRNGSLSVLSRFKSKGKVRNACLAHRVFALGIQCISRILTDRSNPCVWHCHNIVTYHQGASSARSCCADNFFSWNAIYIYHTSRFVRIKCYDWMLSITKCKRSSCLDLHYCRYFSMKLQIRTVELINPFEGLKACVLEPSTLFVLINCKHTQLALDHAYATTIVKEGRKISWYDLSTSLALSPG